MKPRLIIPPLATFGICAIIISIIYFKLSPFTLLAYLGVYVLTVTGFIFGIIAYKRETGNYGAFSFICSLANCAISILITLFFLIAFPSHMDLAKKAVFQSGEAACRAEQAYKAANGIYTDKIDELMVLSPELQEKPFITFHFTQVSDSGFTFTATSKIIYKEFTFSNTAPIPEL